MGIENTHKLIVNCLPLNEGERRAFAKAARDVPQEFVGDEAHRGDMVWSAAVPEELRSRATAVIGNFPVSQASQYTRLEWLQTFSAGCVHLPGCAASRHHGHQCERRVWPKRVGTHVRHHVGIDEEPQPVCLQSA